jgi:hypothetical protein
LTVGGGHRDPRSLGTTNTKDHGAHAAAIGDVRPYDRDRAGVQVRRHMDDQQRRLSVRHRRADLFQFGSPARGPSTGGRLEAGIGFQKCLEVTVGIDLSSGRQGGFGAEAEQCDLYFGRKIGHVSSNPGQFLLGARVVKC